MKKKSFERSTLCAAELLYCQFVPMYVRVKCLYILNSGSNCKRLYVCNYVIVHCTYLYVCTILLSIHTYMHTNIHFMVRIFNLLFCFQQQQRFQRTERRASNKNNKMRVCMYVCIYRVYKMHILNFILLSHRLHTGLLQPRSNVGDVTL